MKKITIALDGPAGSGKTSTAKIVADKLNYIYIDTGAMYRAVTLAWIKLNRKYNEDEICKLTDDLDIVLKASSNGQLTFLNGKDVSSDIRLPEVTALVSPVSAIPYVRTRLVDLQRKLGLGGGVVMDGRDIGTVVFPNAELKIFLIASIDARAKRRLLELQTKGIETSFDEIKKQIHDRDLYDSSRVASPLRKADDAVEINTSDMTLDEQSELIINLALNKINS